MSQSEGSRGFDVPSAGRLGSLIQGSAAQRRPLPSNADESQPRVPTRLESPDHYTPVAHPSHSSRIAPTVPAPGVGHRYPQPLSQLPPHHIGTFEPQMWDPGMSTRVQYPGNGHALRDFGGVYMGGNSTYQHPNTAPQAFTNPIRGGASAFESQIGFGPPASFTSADHGNDNTTLPAPRGRGRDIGERSWPPGFSGRAP